MHSTAEISSGVAGQHVTLGDLQIELRVNEELAPAVLRVLLGRTLHDSEVDSLAIPRRPIWLSSCVRALRAYRNLRPIAVGQRCVYDPSCSRYAELAYRKFGFIRGTIASTRRLLRCRPGSGGQDFP
jgi:putative component of membrane protein insertase Oxa1/YidC/SpoIIIJ protein YidD